MPRKASTLCFFLSCILCKCLHHTFRKRTIHTHHQPAPGWNYLGNRNKNRVTVDTTNFYGILTREKEEEKPKLHYSHLISTLFSIYRTGGAFPGSLCLQYTDRYDMQTKYARPKTHKPPFLIPFFFPLQNLSYLSPLMMLHTAHAQIALRVCNRQTLLGRLGLFGEPLALGSAFFTSFCRSLTKVYGCGSPRRLVATIVKMPFAWR